MSKYEPLTRHLRTSRKDRVPMTFAELENLLGFALPNSSRRHRAWWANNPTGHVNAQAWHEAGYQSTDVDLERERLVFVKLNTSRGSPPESRHPIFGSARGKLWIAPGVDLAAPADPDWGKVTEDAGPWDRDLK